MVKVPVKNRVLMYSCVKLLGRSFAASDVASFPPKIFSLEKLDEFERQNGFVGVVPIVNDVVDVCVVAGFHGAAYWIVDCKANFYSKILSE